MATNPKYKYKSWYGFLMPFFASLTLALFILYISGYKFGTGDQIIHLPFIKYLLDPDIYANDDLIKILKDKPSFFWFIFVPFLKLTGIELGFFVLQIFSLTTFLLAVYHFCREITKSSWGGFIGMLLFIFPKFSFGYSALFSPDYFIPRNFTVGFILIACVLYLRQRPLIAYFILGLIFNLHIISVIPILLTFICVDILKILKDVPNRRTEFKKLFISILGFLVGSAPLLITYTSFLSSNQSADPSIDYADYYNSVLTPFYQLQNVNGFLQLTNAILIILFSLILTLLTKGIKNKTKIFIVTLLVVCSALVGLSVLSETVFKNPLLLQLQLGRSGEYTTLVFISLFSYILVKLFASGVNKVLIFVVLLLGISAPYISPLILSAFGAKVRNKVAVLLLVLLLGFFINRPYIKNPERGQFTFNIEVGQNDNVKAQEWLKNNTQKSAVVLAPYYIGGFTEPDFRTISERTTVLTNADLVETILNADFLPRTKEKINDVTGNSYDYLLKDDNLFNYYIGREHYHRNLANNRGYLKNKYQVSYIVVEAGYSLNDVAVVYENDSYKIYQL